MYLNFQFLFVYLNINIPGNDSVEKATKVAITSKLTKVNTTSIFDILNHNKKLIQLL